MPHGNPIHEAIHNVMKPVLANRRMSVEATIQKVDYENQLIRVFWRDPQSGAAKESTKVPFPVDGDGVFKQALEVGDTVTLSFKNGNISSPYISTVHKKSRGVDYKSKYGAGIPKGMSLL